MGKLTEHGKDIALLAIFAGAFVGLLRAGNEIDDLGYQRQPVSLAAPEGYGDIRIARNERDIIFGPWRQNGEPLEGWAIFGQEGQILAEGQFEGSREPRQGDEMVIRSGELRLGIGD